MSRTFKGFCFLMSCICWAAAIIGGAAGIFALSIRYPYFGWVAVIGGTVYVIWWLSWVFGGLFEEED